MVGTLGNRKCRDLENRSTMTKIVVWPWDSSGYVVKSMTMWENVCRGMGRGRSSPAFKALGTLAWVQELHDDMSWCTSICMLGHQYLFFSR